MTPSQRLIHAINQRVDIDDTETLGAGLLKLARLCDEWETYSEVMGEPVPQWIKLVRNLLLRSME